MVSERNAMKWWWEVIGTARTGTTISMHLKLSKRGPHPLIRGSSHHRDHRRLISFSHQIIISRPWGPWRSHSHPSPFIPPPSCVTCCYLGSLIRPYSLYSMPSVQFLLIVSTALHGFAYVCIGWVVRPIISALLLLLLGYSLSFFLSFFLSPLLSIEYFLLLLLFSLLLLDTHSCSKILLFKISPEKCCLKRFILLSPLAPCLAKFG